MTMQRQLPSTILPRTMHYSDARVAPQYANGKCFTVADSIFQTPARDTPQLLARCFDVDWGYCKCENFIKQPRLLDKMRRALKRYYPLIKAVFKHYAAYKDVRTGDVFNVHWPGWLQFADDIHIKGVGHVRQVVRFSAPCVCPCVRR